MRLVPLLVLVFVVSLGGCQSTLEDVNEDDVTLYADAGTAGVEPTLAQELGSREDAFAVLTPKALDEAALDEGHAHRVLVLFGATQRWMTFKSEQPGGMNHNHTETCVTPATDDVLRVAASCLQSKTVGLQRYAESTLATLADARTFAVLIEHLGVTFNLRDAAGTARTVQALEKVGQASGALVRSGPAGANPAQLEAPWREVFFGALTQGQVVDWKKVEQVLPGLRAWLEQNEPTLPAQVRYVAPPSGA